MLPEDLEAEILVKLPVKSLYRFKCVCKRWHSFIQSSSFINRYNHLSNTRHSGKIICFRKDPITQNHVISLYDHQMSQKIEDFDCPPFLHDGLDTDEEFVVQGREYHRVINILGPVNGIYCIFHRVVENWGGTLVLWNPATREHKHILPPITFPFYLDEPGHKGNYPDALLIGFGFDHNINDYKVVVIFRWNEIYGPGEGCRVRVYVSGTDSWRTIYSLSYYDDELPAFADLDEPVFPYMHLGPEFCHCLVNGVYHWPCSLNMNIVAFDMAEESFEYIRGPPISDDRYEGKSLCVLRETLVMVASSAYMEKAEVWIMKDYGVEDSWDMLHSVRLGPLIGFGVVGVPNHERIYFANKNSQLFSYGIDDHELKNHDVFGVDVDKTENFFNVYLGVLNYVESLTPL